MQFHDHIHNYKLNDKDKHDEFNKEKVDDDDDDVSVLNFFVSIVDISQFYLCLS